MSVRSFTALFFVFLFAPLLTHATVLDSQTDDSAQATRPSTLDTYFRLGYVYLAAGYTPSRNFSLAGVRFRVNASGGGNYICPTGDIYQYYGTSTPAVWDQGSLVGSIVPVATTTPDANGNCNYVTRDKYARLLPIPVSRSNYYVFLMTAGGSVANWVSMSGKPNTSAASQKFFGYRDAYMNSYVWGKSGLESPYFEMFDTAPPTALPDPCATPGACASNILFLPGLEASRLYGPDISGSEKKFWEPGGDSDAREVAMRTDGSPVRDDLYTRDAIDNAYHALAKGDVYKAFLEQLAGLKADKSIADYVVAPYDWRLSLNDILNNGAQTSDGRLYYAGPFAATTTPFIIQELRRLAKNSRTGKVTIIAHSNGGLVVKALTNKLGVEAAQLIDKIIFIAVPQTGTPKAVGAILHGYDQALPIKLLSFIGMSEIVARDLALNMPSVYNLLPSTNYFTYTDDPVITFSADPLLAPWRAAYGDTIHSAEQLHQFLIDSSRATLPVTDTLVSPAVANSALLTKAEQTHASLDAWTPPTGIALTEIAGWGEETLSTIAYYQGLASTCTARIAGICTALITSPVLQYRPETVLDGDGTVTVPSALWTPAAAGVGKYWVNLNKYNDGVIGKNIDRKHADILEIPELRTLIKNIVTNATTSTSFTITSTAQPPNPDSTTRLHFTLHSPLSLNLYDDQGNHTGISTSTNSLEENIPGSRYLTFGEVQYISVPETSNLHLVMNGYTEGSFTLDLAEVQGGVTIASTTFAAIPTSPSTLASISVPDIGLASASPLTVDENSDGVVDISLTPKIGETIIPILYRWDGFLEPISNKKIFKEGSTVPIKFQLKKTDGTIVQAVSPPQWSLNSDVFRWDSTNQQYIYNWSTKGLAAGRYEIGVKLDDGTTHSVTVNLK